MKFDAGDLDWAMGELLHLFESAGRAGIHPHVLNPAVFHAAWSVLNAQPFEVTNICHRSILKAWGTGSSLRKLSMVGKRYEVALAH